jgi:hypothetical protein
MVAVDIVVVQQGDEEERIPEFLCIYLTWAMTS